MRGGRCKKRYIHCTVQQGSKVTQDTQDAPGFEPVVIFCCRAGASEFHFHKALPALREYASYSSQFCASRSVEGGHDDHGLKCYPADSPKSHSQIGLDSAVGAA